jgi:hypothetical protein
MGAPRGNANALKHGLYAKHYDPKDRYGIRDISPDDLCQEIHMMRVVVRNLYDQHERMLKRLERVSEDRRLEELEAFTRLTNSFSLAVAALNTTTRSYAILHGRDAALNDAFEQALAALPVFADGDYLLPSGSDPEEDQEVMIE